MDPYESYEPPSGEETRSIPLSEDTVPRQPPHKRGRGCFSRPFVLLFLVLFIYLFFPLRSNVLVLGIDRTTEGNDVGRSDTMILMGLQPLTGHIDMLSIPRDLWVPIPGYGENRINAAHAFGEGERAGYGPQLALQTVRDDFKVGVGYYLRIRLAGFADVIDALGGVPIAIDQQVGDLPPGSYVLNGEQALAFVRDRTGDDFFRMAHGQLFIVTLGKHLLNPITWIHVPSALFALGHAIDTNIPFWLWPRDLFVMTRAILFDGFDARTLPREAVTPWVTNAGAQVLLPNWELILPLMREMFGFF